MADQLGQNGVLQVIPPQQLELQLQQRAVDKANAARPQQQQQPPTGLIGYIRGQYEIFRNHRNTSAGWSERLLIALRTFNGQYDANKLREIRQFGGSEVYARVIAQKCRAASSLLRDIYLGSDRPWAIKPPSNPAIPPEIIQSVDRLVQQIGIQVQQTSGQPAQPTDLQQRRTALLESAGDAAKKKAEQQARDSTDRVEDILREGFFYHALGEFIVDLPIFPFGCIKGPVVRIIPTVTWPQGGGMPKIEQTPKMTWNRVSPFDLYWTPGVADIQYADMIEKSRLTRAQINDMLDLPGYNVQEVRAVLDEYGRGGLYDNWDLVDAERAVLENRENPMWNRSAMIAMMEFNGHIQGRLLQDYGLAVPDPLRDYFVQVFCIGSHIVKAQLIPSPRQRHYYYITSFEKVPGTPLGNGLTDMLVDLQEVANATLRSLVNNISIASGPQVVVNDQRLSPDETGEDLYPWKRWHVRNDPLGGANNQKPVEFFAPTDNSGSIIQVFSKIVELSDDVSAIPKYIGGQANGTGAGRTAAGLAMLMGNASKILQTVSSNIDMDVFEPLMLNLVDMILLTDQSGLLTGEERISVEGVQVAVQRETIRQRQIEWLQATNNPTDLRIVGLKGRAAALRAVSNTIGLDGEEVVPPEEIIEKMQAQEQAQQAGGVVPAQAIQKGVQVGVEQGIKRITTELTAGELAAKFQMPEGLPTHIGTMPAGGAGQPNAPVQPGGPTAEAARQSQGNLPSTQGPPGGGSMTPNTGAGIAGNAAQPGAPTQGLSPGVG